MQELLRGDVSSRSRVDTFGPLRGSQTSKAVALDVTERHSTTGESEDHSCDRAAYQPSSSGRVLSSTKVELHEPPAQARPYGHKNRYLRSRVGVDPEGREACASSNYLEGRNQSVPRKDSQPFKDLGKTNPVVKTFPSDMEERRHRDLRHPRNPRRGPCQSPVYGPQGQVRRTSHNRPLRDELLRGYPKDQDGTLRGHDKVASGAILGSQGGHQGRLLVSPDSSSVQKVLLLLGRRDHVDVQKDAFRLDHSSLDLHPVNEGDKEVSNEARYLINSFIDDFILWASTRSQALFHLEWTKKVLVWLGFKLNLKKTSESPVQCLIYLGVQLDLESLTLSLPQEKIVKLRSLCNATSAKQKVSRADLEGLIGLVTFSYSVIPLGRMYATPLIVWMNEHTSVSARHAKTSVTSSLRDLLKPFCEGNFLEQKVSFKTLVPDLVLMTDASDFGWSGVILPYVLRDIWSGLDQYRSINEREMLAVTFFVHFMRSTLAGKHVVIHTDSEVVFFCLKRMGSLRSPQMMDFVRQVSVFFQESCLFLPWTSSSTMRPQELPLTRNYHETSGTTTDIRNYHERIMPLCSRSVIFPVH